tara:strand:+ start:253 stop:525 length:273 start_codon:yes stop_codon:yes gene_type:complete
MSRKISSKEKEGLLRATEYVLLGLHRYISHDLNNEEIDYEEYFKEGETITLDQLHHFFQDRSEWFFSGDEFPEERVAVVLDSLCEESEHE